MTGTYKLHNFVTGHYYIGASLDVFERYIQHLKDIAARDKPKKWQRAWDKHPELLDLDAWECEIQEFETMEEAVAEESALLEDHVGQNLCLNIRKTTAKQGTLTQEAREKVAGSLKGRPLTDAHKQRVRNTLKGRPLSEETKAKMKGRTPFNKGKALSDEHRAKLREARARREAEKARKREESACAKGPEDKG